MEESARSTEDLGDAIYIEEPGDGFVILSTDGTYKRGSWGNAGPESGRYEIDEDSLTCYEGEYGNARSYTYEQDMIWRTEESKRSYYLAELSTYDAINCPSEDKLGVSIYPDSDYCDGSGIYLSGTTLNGSFTIAAAGFQTVEKGASVSYYTSILGEPDNDGGSTAGKWWAEWESSVGNEWQHMEVTNYPGYPYIRIVKITR